MGGISTIEDGFAPSCSHAAVAENGLVGGSPTIRTRFSIVARVKANQITRVAFSLVSFIVPMDFLFTIEVNSLVRLGTSHLFTRRLVPTLEK